MKLIVGLGNPGKEYENTRHNIGFMILDSFLGDVKYKEKFNGLYYEKQFNEKVIFLKPQTYMNNSGFSVKKFMDFYKICNKDLLVIHDDLDMIVGKFKYKYNSSSGGHNGIKSIINCLSTQEFCRLKIGISNFNKNDVIDFVLGNFTKNDKENINFAILKKSIEDFINNDYTYVMNKYNGK